MKRSRSPIHESRGSALILFLGVSAAVSILAAALVLLVVNTQHSTAMERQRTKAFGVAEGALDVAMQALGRNWPSSSTSTSWLDASVQEYTDKIVENQSSEFPGVNSTSVRVQLTDNKDATKAFDSNGDGLVFLDSQARIGGKAARVHTLVQATYFDFNLLRGLALWAGHTVVNSGGDPKVTVEVFPPDTTTGSWATPEVTDPSLATLGASYMTWLSGDAAPSLDEVISNDTLINVIALAKRSGRYYTDVNAPANYDGLCVIDALSGTVRLTGNTSNNSPEQPGALIILGGASLSMAGTVDYYGVIYSKGDITADHDNGNVNHGTARIHGMLIADGNFVGGGTPDIRYNDLCIRNLDSQFPIGTRVVPGYWRELKPTP